MRCAPHINFEAALSLEQGKCGLRGRERAFVWVGGQVARLGGRAYREEGRDCWGLGGLRTTYPLQSRTAVALVARAPSRTTCRCDRRRKPEGGGRGEGGVSTSWRPQEGRGGRERLGRAGREG